jgi:hypothetical protein
MRSSRRNPRRVRGPGTLALHPTKGFRRISDRRARAAAKMPFVIDQWSLIGAVIGFGATPTASIRRITA